MRRRLRIGIVGTGMVAQIMHLPYLSELDELYEVQALCDSSRTVLEHCGTRFGVDKLYTDWNQLIDEDLDAVFVLTSGSHAAPAIAAAVAGRHVFVEKPLCYSTTEGTSMLAAAERSKVVLMVGYPKRYDPAYSRAREVVQRLEDLKFARVTTLEAPYEPYVAHHRFVRGQDITAGQMEERRASLSRLVDEAIGCAVDEARVTYEAVLIDTMVHEFNLLRGMLGEPSSVRFASLDKKAVTVVLDFNGVGCTVTWLDLPWHRGLRDGGLLLRPWHPGALGVPIALPEERADVVRTDGWRSGRTRDFDIARGRVVRELLQARAHRLPPSGDGRIGGCHARPRRVARHSALPGRGRQCTIRTAPAKTYRCRCPRRRNAMTTFKSEARPTSDVRIGVVGYGAMGKAHAYAYTASPVMRAARWRPRLTVISGRHPEAVSAASTALGFEDWTTDWHAVVERPDVDIVDICSPPGSHAEIVEHAARNGKAILCEKPLADHPRRSRVRRRLCGRERRAQRGLLQLPVSPCHCVDEGARCQRGDRRRPLVAGYVAV